MRLSRQESNEVNSLITCRRTAKYSSIFMMISTQSKFSRECDNSLKSNEVNLIKMKVKDDISCTWHIRYIQYDLKLRLRDAPKLMIKIQHSSVNIPLHGQNQWLYNN